MKPADIVAQWQSTWKAQTSGPEIPEEEYPAFLPEDGGNAGVLWEGQDDPKPKRKQSASKKTGSGRRKVSAGSKGAVGGSKRKQYVQ